MCVCGGGGTAVLLLVMRCTRRDEHPGFSHSRVVSGEPRGEQSCRREAQMPLPRCVLVIFDSGCERKGPDILSDLVVRLARISYAIRSFIGQLP